MEGFLDLPLVLSIDLGKNALLSEDDSLVLERAVVTALHNVRRHAHASQVLIHADEIGDRWELTIRDDGVGFDADAPRGFGLTTQVFQACHERGIDVALDTAPGMGTGLTFSGRTQQL